MYWSSLRILKRQIKRVSKLLILYAFYSQSFTQSKQVYCGEYRSVVDCCCCGKAGYIRLIAVVVVTWKAMHCCHTLLRCCCHGCDWYSVFESDRIEWGVIASYPTMKIHHHNYIRINSQQQRFRQNKVENVKTVQNEWLQHIVLKQMHDRNDKWLVQFPLWKQGIA